MFSSLSHKTFWTDHRWMCLHFRRSQLPCEDRHEVREHMLSHKICCFCIKKRVYCWNGDMMPLQSLPDKKSYMWRRFACGQQLCHVLVSAREWWYIGCLIFIRAYGGYRWSFCEFHVTKNEPEWKNTRKVDHGYECLNCASCFDVNGCDDRAYSLSNSKQYGGTAYVSI